jgi:pilus assembly protein CpaE
MKDETTQYILPLHPSSFILHPSKGGVMRAVVATESAGLGTQLRQIALGSGVECSAADCVSFAGLPNRLRQAQPDVVLIVLDPVQHALAAIKEAAAKTAAPVLAVGPIYDTNQILQAIHYGALLHLDLTRFREDFVVALEKMHQAGKVVHPQGTLLSVIAAAPGAGVTTVAASLAFALVEQHPKRVVLAELGAGVPELALNLDLKPRHSVSDLALHWDRMDPAMLRHSLIAHATGLNILAYKPETLQSVSLEAPAMRQLVLLLRAMFAYAVLDLGHASDPGRLAALTLSEKVVIVLRLDVPSLRLTRQFVRQLTEQGVPRDRMRLLANRHGQRQQISRKKAEEVIGVSIPEWIPDDPATLNQALNHGLPLLTTARRAPITVSFDNLATKLNGKVH